MSVAVSENATPSSHATPTATNTSVGDRTAGKESDIREVVSRAGQGMAARVEERGVRVCPTDDESLVPPSSKDGDGTGHAVKDQQQQTRIRGSDSRSLDYILKSGLAGGLAGCAVSCFSFYLPLWFLAIRGYSGEGNQQADIGLFS